VYPLEAFEPVLVKAADILSSLSIKYHLTGGITTGAYIEPRYTQDLDLVIDQPAAEEQLEELLKAISNSDFLFDEQAIRSAVESQRMFQLFDSIECLKLDIYPRELIPGELERSVMAKVFEDRQYPIASRVDALVSKLIWVSKGSHKNRRDVKLIYRSCSPDEQAAVREHAAERDLMGLLDEVLAEPDEIE
jgi:hypothetical protein